MLNNFYNYSVPVLTLLSYSIFFTLGLEAFDFPNNFCNMCSMLVNFWPVTLSCCSSSSRILSCSVKTRGVNKFIKY